jgi:hypothetical protein
MLTELETHVAAECTKLGVVEKGGLAEQLFSDPTVVVWLTARCDAVPAAVARLGAYISCSMHLTFAVAGWMLTELETDVAAECTKLGVVEKVGGLAEQGFSRSDFVVCLPARCVAVRCQLCHAHAEIVVAGWMLSVVERHRQHPPSNSNLRCHLNMSSLMLY